MTMNFFRNTKSLYFIPLDTQIWNSEKNFWNKNPLFVFLHGIAQIGFFYNSISEVKNDNHCLLVVKKYLAGIIQESIQDNANIQQKQAFDHWSDRSRGMTKSDKWPNFGAKSARNGIRWPNFCGKIIILHDFSSPNVPRNSPRPSMCVPRGDPSRGCQRVSDLKFWEKEGVNSTFLGIKAPQRKFWDFWEIWEWLFM